MSLGSVATSCSRASAAFSHLDFLRCSAASSLSLRTSTVAFLLIQAVVTLIPGPVASAARAFQGLNGGAISADPPTSQYRRSHACFPPPREHAEKAWPHCRLRRQRYRRRPRRVRPPGGGGPCPCRRAGSATGLGRWLASGFLPACDRRRCTSARVSSRSSPGRIPATPIPP